MLLVVAKAFDIVTTQYLLSRGFVELNPVWGWAYGINGLTMVVLVSLVVVGMMTVVIEGFDVIFDFPGWVRPSMYLLGGGLWVVFGLVNLRLVF